MKREPLHRFAALCDKYTRFENSEKLVSLERNFCDKAFHFCAKSLHF